MMVITAPREPKNPASGSRLDHPHEPEAEPGHAPKPPEADVPQQDQPGPISPDPDYLPDGAKDPLPHVWPAEPETE
jgi:hypothetical protein